jgi:glycosyltransferase involved in cell wall biosynthesis
MTQSQLVSPIAHSRENPRIMIFSNGVRGHHPLYIQHLAEYWCAQNCRGKLLVVVSPELYRQHQDMLEPFLDQRDRIEFHPINDEQYQEILTQKHPLLKAILEWRLIDRYIADLDIHHCFFTCIDLFLLPLALGAKVPCEISGIYLRPTFHYHRFVNHTDSWKDAIRSWRQKSIVSRALKHPKLKHLFCLDPFSADYIKTELHSTKALTLPDPVKPYTRSDTALENLREKLQLPKHKHVFLLFGSLAPRKGIYQTLEATKLLPLEMQQNLCLLLVGAIVDSERRIVENFISSNSDGLGAQVILRDNYISEVEVQEYFEASDVVLAPYQKHVGMSGILLLAAAFEKPVISSDFGLMGELTQQYQLGLTVNAAEPSHIAKAMQRLMSEPIEQFFDPSKMKQWVAQNESQKFAATVFETLAF